MNSFIQDWGIIILYISIMCIIIKVLRQRDKKLQLKKYEIDITIANGNMLNIENQLDTLIESIFTEYKIYNLEYRPNEYIKETDEKQIIEEISDTVLNRISPVFLTQLSTYFNIDNLGSVIASKISLKVMEYRISRNTNG